MTADQSKPRGSAFILRYGASLFGLVLYALFAALFVALPQYQIALTRLANFVPNVQIFNDLGAILQAGTCWRSGVNVYVPSTCMHGGVYNYSPLLLHAANISFGPQDRIAGGIFLNILLIASLALLPPAKSRAEVAYRCAAICSGSITYALSSANFDNVVFLLTLLGVLSLSGNKIVSLAGYVTFLFAAALKFYPAVLLALMARERPARMLAIAMLALLSFAAYLACFAGSTAAALHIIPKWMPFLSSFGAQNLPFGLLLLHYVPVLTTAPTMPQYYAAVAHPFAAPFVTLATRGLGLAAATAGVLLSRCYTQVWAALDPCRALFLTAGALVIVLCFLTVQNLDYRAIFLLFTMPGLWAMATRAIGLTRLRLRVLLIGTLLLLWEANLTHLVAALTTALLPLSLAAWPQAGFWLLRECLWWWVIIQFAALIICFLRAAFSWLPGLQPHA